MRVQRLRPSGSVKKATLAADQLPRVRPAADTRRPDSCRHVRARAAAAAAHRTPRRAGCPTPGPATGTPASSAPASPAAGPASTPGAPRPRQRPTDRRVPHGPLGKPRSRRRPAPGRSRTLGRPDAGAAVCADGSLGQPRSRSSSTSSSTSAASSAVRGTSSSSRTCSSSACAPPPTAPSPSSVGTPMPAVKLPSEPPPTDRLRQLAQALPLGEPHAPSRTAPRRTSTSIGGRFGPAHRRSAPPRAASAPGRASPRAPGPARPRSAPGRRCSARPPAGTVLVVVPADATVGVTVVPSSGTPIPRRPGSGGPVRPPR